MQGRTGNEATLFCVCQSHITDNRCSIHSQGCDEGSLGDLTSDDNTADSSSERLSSDDSSSDSEEKGSEEVCIYNSV